MPSHKRNERTVSVLITTAFQQLLHPHKRRDTKPYSQQDNPQNRSSDYKRLIECEASCPTKHPCQHPSDLEAAMGTALQIIGSSVIYVDRYERFQQELESLYQ